MLTKLNNQLLVNDSQLGDHLNQAVHQGRRSDFGLLLALLSEDARDLPRIADDATTDAGKTDWRQYFELPEQNPLYSGELDHLRAPQLSELAQHKQLDSLRLMIAMRAEPLRHANDLLPTEVSTNLDPRTQARLAGLQYHSTLPQDPSRILSVIESVNALA